MTAKSKAKNMKPFRRLAFLNIVEKDSGAMIAIKASGSLTREDYNDNYQIVITDCSEKVILHGKLNNPDSRTNGLFKINTLIRELEALKEHITTELKENNLRYDKARITGEL